VSAGPWSALARRWRLLGPPLRPAPEDVQVSLALVQRWAPPRSPRALLLGVTPELATMAWPEGTRLWALERNPDMIASVLPTARLPAGAEAVGGDWRAMPFADGSFDIVLGDGCFTTLRFPEDHRVVAAEVRRVLAAGGLLIIRLFVAPEEREPLAAVGDDLWGGRIGNLHVLKWRIAMAIHEDGGVRLGDIWNAYRAVVPDPSRLVRELDWSEETTGTIEVYRDSDARYAFPTLAAMRGLLGGDFAEVACHTPSYELGSCCPTLALRPR
jgi:SAM-dependent methyltransferase